MPSIKNKSAATAPSLDWIQRQPPLFVSCSRLCLSHGLLLWANHGAVTPCTDRPPAAAQPPDLPSSPDPAAPTNFNYVRLQPLAPSPISSSPPPDLPPGRKKGTTDRRKKENIKADIENEIKSTGLCVFSPFAGDWTLTASEERKKERSRAWPTSCFCLWRRVNPRATSDGGTWGDAPPMLLLSFVFTDLSLHCYGFFRVYFVIVFKLFDVIFF